MDNEIRILPAEESKVAQWRQLIAWLRMCLVVATIELVYRAKQFAKFGVRAVLTGLRCAGRGFILSAHATRSRGLRYWREYTEQRDRLIHLSNQLYIHYRVRCNLKRKCPACGHRVLHKIQWSPAHKHILHTCPVCGAVSPELPVFKATAWEVGVLPVAMQQEQQPAVMQGKEEHVARTGIMKVVQ